MSSYDVVATTFWFTGEVLGLVIGWDTDGDTACDACVTCFELDGTSCWLLQGMGDTVCCCGCFATVGEPGCAGCGVDDWDDTIEAAFMITFSTSSRLITSWGFLFGADPVVEADAVSPVLVGDLLPCCCCWARCWDKSWSRLFCCSCCCCCEFPTSSGTVQIL